MIDQPTVARIMDAAHIEEVVSDFVTLRRAGANLKGLCPFHDEKTGSFIVSPGKGIFKCFGCGKGGNSVHFIMEHEHVSYVDALKYLARKYHIEVQERELSDEEKVAQNDRESMLAVNEFAVGHFADMLLNNPDGKAIGLAYFRERGFSDQTIRTFQLGYSLDMPDAFSKTAVSRGYKADFLEKTGLSIRRDDGSLYDRFRGRVMFPVHTISGKVVAFGGRVLAKSDKTAKYVNSPESEIYHKSNELYGIFFAKSAIVKNDRCYLVEGYTDVISMHQAGVTNVVASSGTSLTQGQIRMIHRFTPNITMLYDGDAAGIKASLRGIDLLLEEGMNVKVVLLPEGEDPDSYARTHNAVDFVDYINANQEDFIRFKIRILKEDAGRDPVKRATLIGDVIRSVSQVQDTLTQSEYVKESAQLLDVAEEKIYFEINKLKNLKREEDLKQRQQAANRANSAAVPPPTDIPPEIESPYMVDVPIVASPYDKQERELLNYLVRYGHCPIVYSEEPDQSVYTVGQFIVAELTNDELQLQNALYESFYGTYFEQAAKNPTKPATDYLSTDANPAISRLAIELATDRYIESKFFSTEEEIVMPEIPDVIPGDSMSERNHTNVMMQRAQNEKILAKRQRERTESLANGAKRIVVEYKNAIILEKIRETLLKMKQANETGNDQEMAEQMALYQQYNGYKSILAKELGERVIIKLS